MSTQANDIFEKRLDEMIVQVRQCQDQKQLETCSKCEQYIGCELRNRYISAVYDSMSKGETGGFEF
ncbi:hypothetical protein [Sulfurimonas sp. HSL3-2]|uniref:hypothetical protein n=1 Tax=Hydrocurvibacter mobilis TaxID=3131936 RepID=UPI0031F7C408